MPRFIRILAGMASKTGGFRARFVRAIGADGQSEPASWNLSRVPGAQFRACGSAIAPEYGLHLLHIALWRHAEHAGIFAAELRRAFIADLKGRRLDVDGIRNQQPTRLQQTELLLVLERRQRGQRLELTVEGRGADLGNRGELLDANGLPEATAQAVD